MKDLLNDSKDEEESRILVGEDCTEKDNSGAPPEPYALIEPQVELGGGRQAPQDEEDDKGASRLLPKAPDDEFGLDRSRFIEEQKKTPWIQAMIAFLEDGSLALDAQLRVQVLQMALHHVVRNGILMRKVHLRARVGPACTITVPVIPLVFIETVLHYCHSDVFAAYVGLTKALGKVRKHAYWRGWKRDMAEYVRSCPVCGSGKG